MNLPGGEERSRAASTCMGLPIRTELGRCIFAAPLVSHVAVYVAYREAHNSATDTWGTRNHAQETADGR